MGVAVAGDRLPVGADGAELDFVVARGGVAVGITARVDAFGELEVGAANHQWRVHQVAQFDVEHIGVILVPGTQRVGQVH